MVPFSICKYREFWRKRKSRGLLGFRSVDVIRALLLLTYMICDATNNHCYGSHHVYLLRDHSNVAGITERSNILEAIEFTYHWSLKLNSGK